MSKVYTYIVVVCLASLFLSCGKDNEVSNKLFRSVPKSESGIDFQNKLDFDDDFNIYTYRNYYNGGGVAIGDINNDELPDIFFIANSQKNKLYLNQGNFKFKDISQTAGISGKRGWSTGVTMADINGDGLLDIYVCNSGLVEGDDRKNELFINNGDLTFTESAEKYGLDDTGFSTHATFFDFDNDNDLDVYILNNSFKAIGSFDLVNNERSQRDSLGGDRFYMNDNGFYKDATDEAGIYSSIIGFGLGVLASDLDNDGWIDLYICNDFFERDYIYMNNHDGTFREDLLNQMRSISMASMGVDVADVNNDGYQDIFVTEMLPKMESRLKTSMTFENWERYKFIVDNGYHHQLTRNMLHIHNGFNSKGQISFHERGRMSGIEATDWSWAVLFADFDLNGYKDIYISNGVRQDILNQDYLRHISSEVVAMNIITPEGVDYKQLVDMIPSQPLSNVAFSGSPDLVFKDSTSTWGLYEPGFSNGIAYGDLDNDGDLDLVANNVNMDAFIYENQALDLKEGSNYLKIKLTGKGNNNFAIGAKVKIFQNGRQQVQELIPSRGFQSSMDYSLTFGLLDSGAVDKVIVYWPGGESTILENVEANQSLNISQDQGFIQKLVTRYIKSENGLMLIFRDVSSLFPDDFMHNENPFNDFKKDVLLFHMKSTEGPKMAVGDVNGDGYDDAYLCGAKDSAGKLFIQNPNGTMQHMGAAFTGEERYEDIDAEFFDADNDGDLDLYVVSGGNEYSSSSSALCDRLYLNNGTGEFTKSNQLLPTNRFESTSTVSPYDFDGDGDIDLFVGVRLKDRRYGEPQNGYLLKNDGNGIFTNVTSEIVPELFKIGMIRDSEWADINNDGLPDLMIVGEWMNIQCFINEGDTFKKVTDQVGLDRYSGWWNTIASADLDNDGDVDFIVGNHGLNSRFKASENKPIHCMVNDFDQNGIVEQIISGYNGDASYPVVLRHDLVRQLPYLADKIPTYESYKLKQISDLFTKEQIEASIIHEVNFLESTVLLNDGSGKFSVKALPQAAQLSPVYAIHIQDFNRDGIPDLLLGGNLAEVKPEIGKYDASYGTCLIGRGDGTFESLRNDEIGLFLNGYVRDIKSIKVDNSNIILVAANNSKIQALVIDDSLKTN